MKPYMLFAVLSAMSLSAAAQHATPSRPDDPDATVPVVPYESALNGYVKFREETLGPWRELNEEVARVGGHAGVLRGPEHVHGKRPKPSAARSADSAAPADRKASEKRATGAPKPDSHRHQGH